MFVSAVSENGRSQAETTSMEFDSEQERESSEPSADVGWPRFQLI